VNREIFWKFNGLLALLVGAGYMPLDGYYRLIRS